MTQKEINNIVWKACDSLRGKIDPSQYKDYVLTLLFVKYLSDVWKDKKAFYAGKYNNDATRIERALRNERFQVPETSMFDSIYARRNEANIGEIIDIALTELEDANRTKLANVFRNISFNSEAIFGQTKERNTILKNLLTDFSELDLQPSHLEGNDIIGDAYEYLIARFAGDAGKKAGEFYTPGEVSTLLAMLVEPQPGNRICDPTCGSGSLLIKVAKEVGSSNFSLYGQENNGSTWALCKMNMFLHELDQANIEWGDTINNPKLLEGDHLMKFHVVVANPPFSLDKWGAENAAIDQYSRFHRGVPPKSKGDYAFITHMIETTYEDIGRAGVIVPHGVLFRGSSEGAIRQRLIEENYLDAVIGLPANLFFGTGIPAAILLFSKGRGQKRDVLFIDASRDYEAGKNQNRLKPQDIEKIVSTYKTYKAAAPLRGDEGEVVDEKYAYRATLKELQDNDYNLNIPRYVDTFEEEEPIDIKATQVEIDRLKTELTEVEQQMNVYLQELGF
ncbi:MAG: type I restriction-modification system subunit M [Sphingobacteriales bacterium]|nr:MAG: type I restriction-modification system subunit M [Sphingobacteriales bacterium]